SITDDQISLETLKGNYSYKTIQKYASDHQKIVIFGIKILDEDFDENLVYPVVLTSKKGGSPKFIQKNENVLPISSLEILGKKYTCEHNGRGIYLNFPKRINSKIQAGVQLIVQDNVFNNEKVDYSCLNKSRKEALVSKVLIHISIFLCSSIDAENERLIISREILPMLQEKFSEGRLSIEIIATQFSQNFDFLGQLEANLCQIDRSSIFICIIGSNINNVIKISDLPENLMKKYFDGVDFIDTHLSLVELEIEYQPKIFLATSIFVIVRLEDLFQKALKLILKLGMNVLYEWKDSN
ncbi:hypothetical protein HK096_005806, partial [Nowakowskiella sp. JEL0078]